MEPKLKSSSRDVTKVGIVRCAKFNLIMLSIIYALLILSLIYSLKDSFSSNYTPRSLI